MYKNPYKIIVCLCLYWNKLFKRKMYVCMAICYNHRSELAGYSTSIFKIFIFIIDLTWRNFIDVMAIPLIIKPNHKSIIRILILSYEKSTFPFFHISKPYSFSKFLLSYNPLDILKETNKGSSSFNIQINFYQKQNLLIYELTYLYIY